MGEQDTTINAGQASSAGQQVAVAGELVPTIELAMPTAQESDTAQDKGDKQPGAGDKGNGQGDDNTQPTRLDQHPRFQEVIREKNELKRTVAELQKRMDELAKGGDKSADGNSADGGAGDKGPGGKNIWEQDSDSILDAFNDNPAAFLKSFAENVRNHTLNEITTQATQQSAQERVNGTYEQYAKENPDFSDMWDSGDIQKFMDEHPGHNPISAHMMMTSDTRTQKAIQEAIDKERDKLIRTAVVKRSAAVLGAGAAHAARTGGKPEELKNPEKFGGVTSVLAARLAARRTALSGGAG